MSAGDCCDSLSGRDSASADRIGIRRGVVRRTARLAARIEEPTHGTRCRTEQRTRPRVARPGTVAASGGVWRSAAGAARANCGSLRGVARGAARTAAPRRVPSQRRHAARRRGAVGRRVAFRAAAERTDVAAREHVAGLGTLGAVGRGDDAGVERGGICARQRERRTTVAGVAGAAAAFGERNREPRSDPARVVAGAALGKTN